MSAFRDASAALERVAALEAENAELREELGKLRQGTADPARTAIARQLADANAAVKTLKRKLAAAESRDAAVAHAKFVASWNDEIALLVERSDSLKAEIMNRKERLDDLEELQKAKQKQLDAKMKEIADAFASLGQPEEEPAFSDNRDAVIARLHEERNDLAREVQLLRRELARRTNDKSWMSKVLDTLAKKHDE